MTSTVEELNPGLKGLGTYKYGWSDSDAAGLSARRGLNEEVVRNISGLKNEPQWMLDLRLKGLKLFRKKPMPTWGSDLTGIDFENIKYFAAGRLGGTLIVARAFMSVPGHMFFGAIWGYALGQKLVRKRTSVLLYFLFAAFCHGAFDTVLSIDGLQLLAMVIDGLLAILFVVLLRRALRHGAVTAGKDEAVPSAQRWLFTMGSAGLTVAYTIMISLVAIALFGIGIYYEVEHHRVGMSFVGISATMLLLIGLAANGLSQSIPLDAAVDVEGVTFAGATRKWARIAGIERVPAWNIFGPRGSVKLRSQDGDVLIGPGDPTTVERLIVSLNAAMKPKA